MTYSKCKGLCDLKLQHLIARRKDYLPLGGFYVNRCRRCTGCEKFFIPRITECPCCGRHLKIKPVQAKDKRRMIVGIVRY
jgi:hypothetical protein